MLVSAHRPLAHSYAPHQRAPVGHFPRLLRHRNLRDAKTFRTQVVWRATARLRGRVMGALQIANRAGRDSDSRRVTSDRTDCPLLH